MTMEFFWRREIKPCLDFLPPDLHGGERVGFGQDGDDVDLFMQSFHELHIQRLQADSM